MKGALRVELCFKKLHFVSETGVWKNSSVACGFSSIKIDYSDYPKSLISKINEVYVMFMLFMLLQKKTSFKSFNLLPPQQFSKPMFENSNTSAKLFLNCDKNQKL